MYNTAVIVEYSSYEEYIQSINSLFSVDLEKDDIFYYDNIVIVKELNEIFEMTKDIPLFLELYKTAASLIPSAFLDLGLVIMFSHDYLRLFHPLLCDFLGGIEIKEDNQHYSEIICLMYKKKCV
jgi:hypothetical protein